ncbi:MAG TPA: low molecular weight phosphatase family protein [Gammaproteobacteria bacterium]|mgnify:FL=1|nr:arsenate reductase ArsC [Pseudomonadota bacterium]HBF07534.1 low molecular weight phosphatase family protein [Gammaproteobacteria bacterium]HCK91893.1 low molecular weight phosphatase family protein [Gammaproteobacteria bacterium]|tara:strand:- start:2159 stop:2635 length:477 start_codon:yes stop_codon:yes gene_type:complete
MFRILFICTHNRCRSILSEAITQQKSQGQIQAFSAGSQPSGVVHPLSLKYLKEAGYNTEGLQSQSWDEFKDDNIDLAITVCDSAAAEPCPLWMGNTTQLHWGLADPSKIEGSEETKKEAFLNTIQIIEKRVEALLTVLKDKPTQEELAKRIKALSKEL